jgi:alkylation response protein AidB-like acyl-CoA dehydrogenase
VRFAFTEQQLELRHAVRQVLARECTTGDLRAVADVVPGTVGWRGAGRSAERWSVLDDLGATGLLVDEAAGGVGLSEVELVGVLEEAGRVALPEPLAETACLAGPLLGTTERSTVGGVAVTPAGPAGTTGPAEGAGGALTTPRVPDALEAHVMALFAPGAEGGWELHAVPASEAEIAPLSTLDQTRHLGTVTWTPTPATLVSAGDEAAARAADTGDRGAFAAAAQLLGLADRLIALGADYAGQRQQFGVPIGSFQAVKHQLADARVQLEFARPAVYRAAWSLARRDPDRSEHCAMAKALASDAGDLAARVALQVHGAIGYTWECDVHFFMKRAWALSTEWGDAPTQRARVLASVRRRLG